MPQQQVDWSQIKVPNGGPYSNTCLVPSCKKPVRSRGLCTTHYSQWRDSPYFYRVYREHDDLPPGETRKSDGYIQIHLPGGQKTYKHRLVMEQHLGRPLRPDELVHHIDGNKENNDLSNLQLLHIGEHHPGSGNYYQQWQEALARIRVLEQEILELKAALNSNPEL
jgi:hypothetical protein